MTETKLLNNTLDLITGDSTIEAYEYLKDNTQHLEEPSSQVYNFLYCLAATSGKKEEALKWLEIAIIEKELWYRPEVFLDEDLDTLREEPEFIRCVEKSKEGYDEAEKKAKTVGTWHGKDKVHIALALHGNQQNNTISEQYWSFIGSHTLQIEYLQSKEIDSYHLYRWEDEGTGPQQLKDYQELIQWNGYDNKLLLGFSAGCNTILGAIKEYDVECSAMILVAPWIPMVEKEDLDVLLDNLKAQETAILLICGTEDEDCYPLCQKFEERMRAKGIKVKSIYEEGLGHDYPEDYQKDVIEWLCMLK